MNTSKPPIQPLHLMIVRMAASHMTLLRLEPSRRLAQVTSFRRSGGSAAGAPPRNHSAPATQLVCKPASCNGVHAYLA